MTSDMDRWDAFEVLVTPANRGEAFAMGVIVGVFLMLASIVLGDALAAAGVYEVVFP